MTNSPPQVLPRSGKRYTEAIDAQLDVLNFWRSDAGREYANGYVAYARQLKSTGQQGIRLEHPPTRDMLDNGLTEGDMLAIREFHSVAAAAPYWVSGDLSRVITRAAKTLPDEPLGSRDLPTPSGFIVLDEPLYTIDRNGLKIGIKIIRWTASQVTFAAQDKQISSGRAVHVSWYSEKSDPNDEGLKRIRETRPYTFDAMPRYGLWHQDAWFWAHMPDDAREAIEATDGQDTEPEPVKRGDVRIPLSSEWGQPRDLADIADLVPDPEENLWLWIPGDDEVAAWLHAFFRIVNQDIVRVSRLEHRVWVRVRPLRS